jgi:hypothetical protein
MLMFSLWLSTKSKNARWGIIIALWLGVRLASTATTSAGWQILSYALITAYLVFVVFSWIGSSLANLYLSFHKEGRYALTTSETYNSRVVGAVISLSILLLIFARYFPMTGDDRFVPAIIMFSLAMPFSQVNYPIHFKSRKLNDWLKFGLIIIGLVIIPICFLSLNAFSVLLTIYLAAFVVYSWVGSFGR